MRKSLAGLIAAADAIGMTADAETYRKLLPIWGVMRNGVQRTVSSWLEALRKVGFFLRSRRGECRTGISHLVAAVALCHLAAEIYTITVLSLIAAGLVSLIVAGFCGGGTAEDTGQPRRNALTVLLTTVIVVVGIAGAYGAAVLFARRLWASAPPTVAAVGAVLWLLGLLRRLASARKAPALPAENRGE